MIYLPFNKQRIVFSVMISVVIHALILAWIFHAKINLIFIDSNIRSPLSTNISLHISKEIISKIIENKEQIILPKKNPKAITQPKKEITKTNQITQIPVIANASFKGKRQPPHYPRRALRMQQEGTVLLKALVNKRGKIQEVKILDSSGFPILDRSAAKAVWGWKFNPTYVNSKPILSWIKVPVEFKIQ